MTLHVLLRSVGVQDLRIRAQISCDLRHDSQLAEADLSDKHRQFDLQNR